MEVEQEALSDVHSKLPREIGTDYGFKRKIVWLNVVGFFLLHLAALIGLVLCFSAKSQTLWWSFLVLTSSGMGVTMGAHRLWAHRAFKATFIVRLVLIMLHTVAGQNCLYIWVRDHRQHHKFSDTDADPHNSNRGFFFSHVGWLMSRKHPAVISKGKTVDISDLEADPLVMLQKKFYKPLYAVFAVAIPVLVPVYFWNEGYIHSLFVSFFARYLVMLNLTWLINSATHIYGMKPYDKNMNAVENPLVSFFALGEGWHNYHHAFPYDYRAAELGLRYSVTTFIIDILAYFGLIYDLKSANRDSVRHRTLEKGDGTHPLYGNDKQKRGIMDSIEKEDSFGLL